MTELTNSQRIQDAISKASGEREALAVLLTDLQAEQRKLAAVRTIGALSDAQAARLDEVTKEIAEKQARHTEIGDAITGASAMLSEAQEEERAAVEGAIWDAAESKLKAAEQAAGEAHRALLEAGARYSDCQLFLQEAYRDVARIVRPHLLTHLQPPDLKAYFGHALAFSGGPDYGARVWHLDRCQPPPPLDAVVAGHAARFMARRGDR